MTGGLSMESIDLETPRKFLQNYQDNDRLNTPNTSPERLENNLDVSRQLDFENEQRKSSNSNELQKTTNEVNETTENSQITETETNAISSTDNQHNYSFQPGVISTPTTSHTKENQMEYNNNNTNSDTQMVSIPIAQTDISSGTTNHNNTVVIASSALNTQLDLIAVPIPGQPNCFQLARVVNSGTNNVNAITIQQNSENCDKTKETNTSKMSKRDLRYSKPYDTNYSNNYISVQRHIIAEYKEKFKSLQEHAQDDKITSTTTDCSEKSSPALTTENTGFTQYQYDLMQQQLRIHIQQLTQTFVQTYCHPELWKLAPKSKELLMELQEKSKTNVNFRVWNLEPAIELIHNWQKELDVDTPENTELMNFLYREINATYVIEKILYI